MSNYHYGMYSSTTPRPTSSNHALDKNTYAQTLTCQIKSQHKSLSRSPESFKEKKSPLKTLKKIPKPLIDNFFAHLPQSMSHDMGEYYDLEIIPSNKSNKKLKQTSKENIHKSNSPPKTNNKIKKEGLKKSGGKGPEILINDYEPEPPFKLKPNSVKSVSLHQGVLNQQFYESDFADWLHKKVQSTRNSQPRELEQPQKTPMQDEFSYKYPEGRHQHSTSDLHNIWPETKKAKRVESQTHRQSSEIPSHYEARTATAIKKKRSPKKHLKISPQKKEVLSSYKLENMAKNLENFEREVQIMRQKLNTPKDSITRYEQVNETVKKIASKLSPRNGDSSMGSGVPPVLYSQIQSNPFAKMYSSEARNVKNNNIIIENQKYEPMEIKDPFRSSLETNYSSNGIRFEYPKTTKHSSGPTGGFFAEEYASSGQKSSSPQKKKQALTGNDSSLEEARFHAKLQTAKKSNPNILNDLNNYMDLIMYGQTKRDSKNNNQLQEFVNSPLEGDNFVLSTRSALDKYEYKFNAQHPTEESEQPHNNMQDTAKKIYSSLTSNKNSGMYEQISEENPKTREIVNELLKRTNSKETIVNPNAKFLLLRKQIQEKRGKLNFKSADWGVTNSDYNNPQLYESNPNPGIKGSPKQVVSPERHQYLSNKVTHRGGGSDFKKKGAEDTPVKAQLNQLLNKTKNILGSYKKRENVWGKEKKAMINEILHLRSVIENG